MAEKMKKFSLISAREAMESILRDLIDLGCIDVSEQTDLLGNIESSAGVARESYCLRELDANYENLEMLGTQHTLMLFGWAAASSETALKSKLNNHICAWEIDDPSPDESANAPVKLCCPFFFGKLRMGGHRSFAPLVQSTKHVEQSTQSDL